MTPKTRKNLTKQVAKRISVKNCYSCIALSITTSEYFKDGLLCGIKTNYLTFQYKNMFVHSITHNNGWWDSRWECDLEAKRLALLFFGEMSEEELG